MALDLLLVSTAPTAFEQSAHTPSSAGAAQQPGKISARSGSAAAATSAALSAQASHKRPTGARALRRKGGSASQSLAAHRASATVSATKRAPQPQRPAASATRVMQTPKLLRGAALHLARARRETPTCETTGGQIMTDPRAPRMLEMRAKQKMQQATATAAGRAVPWHQAQTSGQARGARLT